MIHEAKSARVLNALANSPSVFPHVCNDPTLFPLDLSEGLGGQNVAFHNGENDDDLSANIALTFVWTGPGIFEVHTLALPNARGGPALEFTLAAFEELFIGRGAAMLWGQTPLANERARAFNRKLGAEVCGTGTHPVFGAVEYFRMSRSQWDARS